MNVSVWKMVRQKGGVAFMVALLLLPPVALPSTAHAQQAVVEVGPSLLAETKTQIETTIQTGLDAAEVALTTKEGFKEYILDPLSYAMAEAALRSVTRSIVNWINSGFEGQPSFVSDLDGFLLDAADEAAGQFIYGTELGALCSPFELDIRIALNLSYRQTRDFETKCTLTGITENIEGFYNGNFAEGGWRSWFELTAEPDNSPYASYIKAEREFSIRLANKEAGIDKELTFGGGFLSQKLCELVDGEDADVENCIITTPGKVIQEQLNFQLTVGGRKLIVADEIGEIVSALFAQLAQQVITGANGLLGANEGAGGTGGFLDRLTEENLVGQFGQQIANEVNQSPDDFITANQRVVDAITKLESEIADGASTPKASGGTCSVTGLSSTLEAERRTALQNIADALRLELDAEILRVRLEQESDINEQNVIAAEAAELIEQSVEFEVRIPRINQRFDDTISPAIADGRALLQEELRDCRTIDERRPETTGGDR